MRAGEGRVGPSLRPRRTGAPWSLTPRSRRHRTASHALHLKSLIEKKLQAWIRVKCAGIIRRYEKTSKLQRLVKAMAETAPGSSLPSSTPSS